MAIQLHKVTPVLNAECESCKDIFLQALKYTIPEFAQTFSGEYYFTVDGMGDTLQGFIDNYVCSSGEITVKENSLCDSDTVKPYIDGISTTRIMISTLTNVTITGNHFDDRIDVQIDNCSVQILEITPTEIKLDITGSAKSDNEVKIKRCGIESFGKTLVLEVIDTIEGDGQAGSFSTSFGNNTGDSLWGADWNLEIFGGINSIKDYFRSSKNGTPSGSTGPAGPNVSGDYYMYIETSNPNNGAGKYATASTRNFKQLESIEFDYHMYGSSIGELLVEGKMDGLDWEVIGFMTGQQNAQADQFMNKKYMCSGYNEIRFCFNKRTSSTGYTSDIALDNIVITSV